jgi:predicted MPP superfamily phosphohydrolase
MQLSRRDFLRIGGLAAAATGISAAGSAAYARKIEPDWVKVERVSVPLARLEPALQGFRILQLSDIHMDGRWMTLKRLAEWIKIANRQKPDLIVITGDLITEGVVLDIKPYAQALGQLRARHGKMAVLGNHDYWSDADKTRRILRQAETRDMSNLVFTIQEGGASLHIAGVDDVLEGMDRLDNTLDQIPTRGAAILMVHEPDFADAGVTSGRFDFQISGHSHGGQVIIPGVGPFVLPPLGRKYPLGLHRVGNMLQYTNRGLGMVAPYVRFFCPPEITVFTLVCKNPAG